MSDNNTETYILLTVMGTTYALRSDQVQHMEMVEHITPVPNAPPHDSITVDCQSVV